MDGVAGDHAVNHTLQEASDLLTAWNGPDSAQADIARSAATICSWLKRLCFQNSTRALYVSDLLIKLAQAHITLSVTTEQKVIPSTKDRVISVLDHHEHSIQFWVLDCIAEILSSVDPRDTIQDDLDAEIPQGLINYCFSRLSLAYTVPVQTAAARCLGSLSKLYLEGIIDLILSEMKKCSSDTQVREFVIIQRAVSSLDFSVQNLPVTVKYLEELAAIGSKIDRGVLRSEICLSLKAIMQKMIGGEQKDILEQNEHSLAFWNVFARLYRLVGKWAKKTKHAVFCYSFMITCVCLGQVSFFVSSNREDVFKLVMNGLRKEDLRLGCIAIARDYIRDVNPIFFRDDTDLFNNQVQTLVANVLPKKKAVLESELSLITEILVAVGRKHMHYLVNEIAASVLKPKSGYTDSSKCALLSALCIIAKEIPSEMETYNYTLGPLIAAIIEGDSEPPLLCAALLCFPAIAHSKWDRVKMTGAHVAALTLNPNHDIAASASGALHRFALRNPQTNLLLSLYSLIDVLAKIFQDNLSTQIRIMSNVKVMLASYDELIILNGSPDILVPFECWIAVRHHLEGICLLWLLHPEAWVRKEASGLIQILGYSGIRQLDRNPSDFGTNSVADLKAKDKLNLLVDYLNPQNADLNSYNCPELNTFLLNHYDKFEGVIAWAWSVICDSVGSLIDKERLIDGQSEIYHLWKNQFTFLCLGLRVKTAPFNELTTESYRQDYQTRKETLQFLRQCFVCLHLSLSDLVSFSQHVSSLLRIPSNRIWKETRRAMMMLNVSTYDLLAQQLKIPVFFSSPSTPSLTLKRKGKRNQLEEFSEYFFYDRIVELYERVLLNVTEEKFKSFTFIPTHLPDFVSAWLSPENQTWMNEAKADILISMLYWLKPFCRFFPIICSFGTFSICQLQFTPERQPPDAVSDADAPNPVLDLRKMLFSFVSSVAFPRVMAEKKAELQKIGQIAASQAVAALLEMGPISDDVLFANIMKWLSQLGLEVSQQSSTLLTSYISQAFTAVLAHHPFQLLDFLVLACNSSAQTDYYVHAVCNNLILSNPKRSSFIKPITDESSRRERAGVVAATHPCTILVASLLCQVSSSAQIRKRGLQLCRLTEPEFGQVVVSKMISHSSMDVCIQMAYDISSNVAKYYALYAWAFFDAVSFFAYNLPEPLVQTLLEFCNPWIEQFSSILEERHSFEVSPRRDEVESSTAKAVFEANLNCGPFIWPILDSFLHLTKVVHVSFAIQHQVGLLWELLGNQEHRLLPFVLNSFLELQFREAPELCQSVNTFLVRSDLGQTLATMQLAKVTCFQDTVPIQQISMQPAKSKVDSPINWDPSTVSLVLLTDVIFERPEYVRDQLPLILHSACVLEIPSLSNLLIYTLLDLGITPKPDEIYTPLNFAALVLRKNPVFAKRWCKLAFDWALFCPDRIIANRSLEFYCMLNVWFDLRIGMHIAMQIRDSLHEQDVSSLSRSVYILTSVPTQRSWTGQEWTLYIVIGFSLLAHRFQPVFELGLRLLDKCWQIASVPETDQIIMDLKPLWEFSSIRAVTAKGFTTEETFTSTLHVLLVISQAIPEQDSAIDVVITVTLLAMMIELETRKVVIQDSDMNAAIKHLQKIRPAACECMENLHRVIIAICSGSADDIRAVNHERKPTPLAPSGSRQSIISTVGRASVSGTRRISKHSVISGKELNTMHKNMSYSSASDAVVSIDDLLNIVPELCRRVLSDSRMQNPLFSVELLEDVLSSDEAGWRKPCLWLLDAMLDELHFEISSRHFAKLGKILSYYCHDPDIEVATAAEIVCAGLFDKAPESYHNGAFKFFHSGGSDIKAEAAFHFDQACSAASFQECIRFFDGPVSSLIQGLSTLYTPVPVDSLESCKVDRRSESQEFSELQSQIVSSEHRGSIETAAADVDKTYVSNNPSSQVLDVFIDKSPLNIDMSVDEDSASSAPNSLEASLDARRQSLPILGMTTSTLTSVSSHLSSNAVFLSQRLPRFSDTATAAVIARTQDQTKWYENDSGSESNDMGSGDDMSSKGETDDHLDVDRSRVNAAAFIAALTDEDTDL